MKMKHNKKRNTAFLYESLIKELTKAIVRKQEDRKKKIVEIIKKYFNNNSILREELDVYNSIITTLSLNKEYSLRLMYETKKDYDKLDKKDIFNLQTKLIKDINEGLSNEVFANFISNYRTIASIGQFFNSNNLNAKQRILLETKIIKIMSNNKEKSEELKHIDNLTYKTFVNKFNTAYKSKLRKEQKDLLTNYIVSFSDNGLGLKCYLNEEIGRLKKVLSDASEKHHMNSDLQENTRKVIDKLHSFSKKQINEQLVKDIFYIQDLAYEVSK